MDIPSFNRSLGFYNATSKKKNRAKFDSHNLKFWYIFSLAEKIRKETWKQVPSLVPNIFGLTVFLSALVAS